MSKKYLIHLDVNNTLLDTNYHSTSPTIQSVIEQLSKEGSVFVINSDRSFDDIQAIAQLFSITGPIIGEKGAFIYYPDTGKTQVMLNEQTLIRLDQIKELIKKFISEKFFNSHFLIGDTTDINKHADGQDLPPGMDYYFMMNCFRRYSISIHVRKNNENLLQKDIETAERFCSFVESDLLREFDDFTVNCDADYANMLIHPKQSDKALSFLTVAQKYPNFKRIIITDDLNDKPAMKEIDYLFAVNNASDEAKEAAHYVATETITKGVEEILLKIDELVR
ncbi:MAG: HAD family hydrolase [Patescibacteria group bacterium]